MDHLLTLRNSRAQHTPWPDVARALLTLEQTGPLDETGQPWIQAAASVSGYSVNHLRRLSKSWQAISDIDKAYPGHGARLQGLSASHAEVLARLWQVDADKVGELLSTERWPSYGDLLRLYETRRSSQGAPAAAGKLAATAFRKRVQSLLAGHVATGEIIAPYLHYTYAKPDLLNLTTTPIRVHAAYDCLVVPPKVDADQIQRRFVSLATEASFFDSFWLVVSDAGALYPIISSIEILGLANVGVMTTEGSGLETVRPPSGQPTPDRRPLHREFMSSYGTGILAKWRQRPEG
jgi:hypothetical protein